MPDDQTPQGQTPNPPAAPPMAPPSTVVAPVKPVQPQAAQPPAQPNPNPQATPQGTPEYVPYHRFQEVNTQLKASRDELASMIARTQQLESQMHAHIAEVTTLREATARGLTDPEGLEIARTLWGAQPTEGRKPFGEWLDAAISGEKPVKALVAYLPQAPAPNATTPQPQGAKPAAATMPPKVPAAPATPAASGRPDMSYKAVASGNPEARAALAKMLGGG